MHTINRRSRGLSILKSLALASTALAGLALPTSASAQEWVGGQNLGWDWFNPLHWNPAAVPTAADNVTIDTNSPAATFIEAAAAHADGIVIGKAGQGSLGIISAGTLTSNTGVLGDLAGSEGVVAVLGAGSTWSNSGSLTVGNRGSGTLHILSGGAVSNAFSAIGAQGGSSGTAVVNGAGSTWTNTSNLYVGDFGAGVLTISNGGAVSNANAILGAHDGSAGTATVEGAGSTWTSSLSLVVGLGGSGALTVSDGGAVSNDVGVIASGALSTSTVTVTDAGSTWTNNGDLTVGGSGVGTLNITNGGKVSNSAAILGAVPFSSSGTAVVDGAGSTWTNASTLYVGDFGVGVLTISNGGAVSNANAILGAHDGSAGTATVDGAGSTWASSLSLVVGLGGSGALTVADGGAVSNDVGVIASGALSTSTVTVTDAGSTWTNNGDLTVGASGVGTLNIINGGKVSNSAAILGAVPFSSSGTVLVDGAGSTWISSAQLSVGDEGAGALTISDGGMVSSNVGYVGLGSGSNGSVIVTGAGSTWMSGIALDVGFNGIGTLMIAAGGTVTANYGDIGIFAGSMGTVTVDGAGSALTFADDLVLGSSAGVGVLNIQNGGTVANQDGTLGSQPGSTGTAHVAGAGSTWTNAGDLVVGHHADGTLVISGGGAVTSASALVGRFDDATGTVTVTGAGSIWTNSGNLIVAEAGSGAMTISGGGAVSNAFATIGNVAGALGVATVSGVGSTWTNSADLTIGWNGAGLLTIENGGQVTSAFGGLAANLGATGAATITGPGSGWTSASTLFVGVRGAAVLTVAQGGVATNLDGVLGYDVGATGLANVDGAGSIWNNNGSLTVGEDGVGALGISNGGSVSAGGVVTVAANGGSSGDLNIGGSAGAAATGAGTLVATSLQFGAGTGSLNFNHTGVNYAFSTAMSGAGTVNHLAGVTHLTGDSSGYTGTTHVLGGTLLVDGKLGTGPVDVQSGGTLGGMGQIAGAVTIASGGTLAGAQGQTLAMGSLNLTGGANVDVTLSTPGGSALFSVANDLTLDGALNITSGGAFGPGIYSLMTYGGVLTDNGLDIGTTPNGTSLSDFTVQTAVAGQVNLVSTALPVFAFWDGDAAGSAGNNAIDGGGGVWSAVASNWTDVGGTTNGAQHPQPGFAIFQGAAGTVTVDPVAGDIAVTGMQFASDGYQLTGGPVTLTDASSIIRVGDGSAAGAGYTAVIGSVLAGPGGLNKTDLGLLILTADNTYAGGTTITNGALQLGDGGTGGSVIGDIDNNGVLIFNRADVTSFGGVISGGGVINQNGAGRINLTGDSVGFAGSVNVNSGVLGLTSGGKLSTSQAIVAGGAGSTAAIAVDGAGSTWVNTGVLVAGFDGHATLTVTNGGALSGDDGYLGFNVGSSGAATVDGAGSTWTSSAELVVGVGGAGSLSVVNGGVVTSNTAAAGYLFGADGVVVVNGAGSSWGAVGNLVVGVGGDATLTVADGGRVLGGALVLAESTGSSGVLNIGAAAGLSAAGAGALTVGYLQFGDGAGVVNFNHTDTGYVFSTAMTGAGAINQWAGVTSLTGNSSGFVGAVNVNGGRLAVNGLLGGGQVTVNNGGVLGGNGVIGSLTAQTGSIVAPGNSIGAINVLGNANFAAGSIYQVELNAAGQSDVLNVGGVATIANGASLSIVKVDAAPYVLGTHYTILSAAGGVSGAYAFDNIQLTNFIGLVAGSDANSVYLDVAKLKTFASAGGTANQTATGTALDSLPAANGLATAIVNLPTDAAAQAAFDQLSGEIHASTAAVMIDDSRFVRDAATTRLRMAAATDGVVGWGQAYGSWGQWDSDGNAASTDHDIGGFIMGGDALVGDKWRVGVFGGYSRSAFDADARNASGESDNYDIGLYAGSKWGESFAVRGGVAHTWHDLSTSRAVSFAGFSDTLATGRRAGTTQAFGELGYTLQRGAVALEPFASLAYVSHSTDDFTETGGAAALSGEGRDDDVTFTTLGVRAASDVSRADGATMTVRGALGWRHAAGDITPSSMMSFPASTSFGVAGAPIGEDVAVVEGGVDMSVRSNVTVSVSYGGQFGSGVTDQTARATLAVRF